MTSKLLKPVSFQKVNKSLFSGIWLRWDALTAAERLICVIIVLMPVWWALGIIQYLVQLITLGIALYEWRCHGKLPLKRPNLVVVALFASFAFGFADTFLLVFNAHPLAVLPPGSDQQLIDLVKSPLQLLFPFLVWYIQSNNIRVRLESVAWACSVSVIQQLSVWLFACFLFFSSAAFDPPRTLLGSLTGKAEHYLRGSGETSYLLLYYPSEYSIGGLPRFHSFFYSPDTFALFVGVVGVLALSLKNRLWSLLLLTASIFLIGMSGTRTAWIAFSAALLIHFLFTAGNVGGSRLLVALIAIVSFVTLSLSPVTDLIFNTYTDTTTYLADYRSNSTDDRAAVYEGTIEKIIENDNPLTFIFGHKVDGPPVVAGTGNTIGSHSYLLGSLLYKGGLVGTGLFMTFWVSLFMWLHHTRMGRPICCVLILLLVSVTLFTQLLGVLGPMAILLSMVLRRPAIAMKSPRRMLPDA